MVFVNHFCLPQRPDISFLLEESCMVFNKIREIICTQLDIEPDKVTMDASVTDNLGADSLDLVELVMSIEEEFDLEVPDSEIENLKTVGDIVRYIEANS